MWRLDRRRRRPPTKTCHVINILSEFSNFRVSESNIMMLFIYSRSISRSVAVVHFVIGLNKVVSYGVIPHYRDVYT